MDEILQKKSIYSLSSARFSIITRHSISAGTFQKTMAKTIVATNIEENADTAYVYSAKVFALQQR